MKKSLVLMALLASSTAFAASFDCNKAATKIEKQICGNNQLSKLDSELGEVYSQVAEINGIKDQQRIWIKDVRNNAPNDAIMIAVYSHRIQELKELLPKPEIRIEDEEFLAWESITGLVVPSEIQKVVVKPHKEALIHIKPYGSYEKTAKGAAMLTVCAEKEMLTIPLALQMSMPIELLQAAGHEYDWDDIETHQIRYADEFKNLVEPDKMKQVCQALKGTFEKK